MRKTATSFLAVGLFITAFASAAMAGSLLTENFTYADGNLIGNGGWVNYSGAGAGEIQVSSNRAVGTGAAAPDDHVLFAVQPNTSKTYACFDVIISDPGGVPKAVYFAELKDASAAALVSRVYVMGLSAANGGGWTFAISHSSTSATVGVALWSTASLNYGQQYRIVINYDPVATSSTLWVDPLTELSPSVTIVNAAVAPLAVQGFGLRQSGTASTLPVSSDYVTPGAVNVTYSLDNLGVGLSMLDACDGITPTDKSTWGRLKAIYRN